MRVTLLGGGGWMSTVALLAQDGPHRFRRAVVVHRIGKASVPCGRLAVITQEASVSHGTDWPYLALSVPWDKLHKWVSVSCDRLAYSTCAVSWLKVGFSVIDRLST